MRKASTLLQLNTFLVKPLFPDGRTEKSHYDIVLVINLQP